MRSIFCSGLVLLLAGCTSLTTNYYTQTVHGWRGGNVQNLMKEWGQPDTKVISPNGNMFLVYKTESYRSYNAPTSPQVGVHFSPNGSPILVTGPNPNMTASRSGGTLSCYAGFEANPQGRIIKTQIQGAGCYGSQSFANQRSNPEHQ